jgi:signal peptidase I
MGLPGEQVTEKNGFFYVDGTKLNEPYLTLHDRDSVTRSWPRLAKDQYFVMGDNRLGSCDSRTWGSVPRSAFIGPVVATYWPPNRWTVR